MKNIIFFLFQVRRVKEKLRLSSSDTKWYVAKINFMLYGKFLKNKEIF